MKNRMKKKLLSIVLALALILMYCPVNVEAAGNTYRTATKVTLGTKYYGRISSGNMEDWYKIVLPSSGQLTIKFQSEIQSVYIKLYNNIEEDDSYIFSDVIYWNSTTKIKNETYIHELNAGTYYFYINEDDYIGNYNFTASFKASGESFLNGTDTSGIYHGDGTRQTANKISLGKTYKGHMAENEEYDFYKFTLSKKSNVVLTASSNMDCLSFELYDGEGNYLMRFYEYRNSTTKVANLKEAETLKKGTYYLVIDDDYYGNYSFKLTAITPGWKKTNGKWWYQYEDGTWPASRFATIGGKVYYFNGSGYMVTGWKKIDGYWYYFNKTTGVRKVGWLYDGGKWYYMDSNGRMLKSTSKYYQGKNYYFNSSGVCTNP